jgi:hypothetical protein
MRWLRARRSELLEVAGVSVAAVSVASIYRPAGGLVVAVALFCAGFFGPSKSGDA